MTRQLHFAAMLLTGMIVSAAVHAQSSERDDGSAQSCWDGNRKAVRLYKNNETWWMCTICKQTLQQGTQPRDPYALFRR
jgi:hypothetical protein